MNKKIMIRSFFISLALIISTGSMTLLAQKSMTDLPLFGAQVFIEPGQTDEEIDTWFRMLRESGMKTTRIRMFESYMRKSDDTWDFSLFDKAFRAAEKYDILVYVTIFPYTEKTDIGGFKFPEDEDHWLSIADFIKNLVIHFSQYSSMYAWVLINEPGVTGEIPWTEFTKQRFKEWLINNPPKEYTDNGYPILVELTDQRFLVDYNTWYLNLITNEILKYDTTHIIHVNNHDIFRNCAEYNFPEWRKFLTTIGGSAHAGWHFGYFKREQYTLAMSANSAIMRSGAGELPWIMTEIQGGNNTYSARAPLCPTGNEIAQWMWTIIGSQGKGGIFWSLNPRSSGIEAGEWAMLDFQDQPSDRLLAAAEVIDVINSKPDLFRNARVYDTDINLIYIRESLWAEKKMLIPSVVEYEARKEGGIMKSLLGYFETISELGINCNIKEIGEFDFTRDDYTGSVIILAHQISVPSGYVRKLETFVMRGGKLIMEGLTGFFDEDLHNTMKTGFPLASLLGGNISEFKMVDNLFSMNIGQVVLPAHLWRGYIDNSSAEVVSTNNGKIVATRKKSGNGETLWIPSLIGLGAYIDDNRGLADLLAVELKTIKDDLPFTFASHQKGLLMKTLKSGNSIVTVIINKSKDKKKVELKTKYSTKKPAVLFADKMGTVNGFSILIHPEETMVIEWK